MLWRTTVGFLTKRIGWNRIGLAISITIILVATIVLYRTLRTIDISDLADALQAIPRNDVIAAGVFVASGYMTLTLYDWFALSTIGRADIPYRIAALAGFTSYAVGHSVGVSALSGGAVRYRVYSRWGLTIVDVAKICFVAGLTFWLGNATVLGLGLLYEPSAATRLDHLPPWINRLTAGAVVAALTCYLVWVWRKPRVFGFHDWNVTLPSGPLTLVQIAIGIADLSCCALAMYVLLPDEPRMAFVSLAVVFVSATLLGFASAAPAGGLGVFDAAMFVALWQFEKEQLLAGLLVFRVLYYVVPLALSLCILAVRELLVGELGAPHSPSTRTGKTAAATLPRAEPR
jgi:uncharacterized membrane protein YbhN (UPF0104 family)